MTREDRFNKEINDAVKGFMLKITAIAAEYRTEPFELLREAAADVIAESGIMEYKFGTRYDYRKGDDK